MTNDIMKRNPVRTGEADSQRARRKEIAGAWRHRRLVFDSLESRRLLSTNVANFPIRVEGGDLQGVASGAGTDTNIWFTLSSNNIGMINPANTSAGVTQYPIPTFNSGPGPIAAGPDGNYWFFEQTTDQFGVINPTTGVITEIPLSTQSDPQVDGIAAGPNGYVWFTEFNSSLIGLINTTTDQITELPTTTPGAEPYGIVEGPGRQYFGSPRPAPTRLAWSTPPRTPCKSFPLTRWGATMPKESPSDRTITSGSRWPVPTRSESSAQQPTRWSPSTAV